MGLKFCNEAIISLKQIWPASTDEKEELSPLQAALLERLGASAYPFSLEVGTLAPPSVQLVPAKRYTGAPIGTSYDVRVHLGECSGCDCINLLFLHEMREQIDVNFRFFPLFSGPRRGQIQSTVDGSIGRSCYSQNYIRNEGPANRGAKSTQIIEIITLAAIAKSAEINKQILNECR